MQRVTQRDTQASLPTTAKLFGALGLAAAGFFTAEVMLPYLPRGSNVHGLAAAGACIGLVLGWRVIGLQPGQGMGAAMRRGLTAALLLAFWGVVFLGALQMVQRIKRNRYDGPLDALVDIIAQGLRMGAEVLRPDVVAVLFLGSMLSAMLSEWAWKRWQ